MQLQSVESALEYYEWQTVCTIPERQCVISHKGLALSDQEGAVRSSSLQAVLRQQPLGYLPPVPPCAQLPVEPFLRHVLVHTIGHLGG